jgi:hypothetical protein
VYGDTQPIGQHWTSSFLLRNPSVAFILGRKVDVICPSKLVLKLILRKFAVRRLTMRKLTLKKLTLGKLALRKLHQNRYGHSLSYLSALESSLT